MKKVLSPDVLAVLNSLKKLLMPHSMSTRRVRHALRRLTIVFAVAIGTAIIASPAAAAGPTKTDFAYSFSLVLTDVCPFPLNLDSTVSGTQTDFVDKSGALTRSHIHQVQQDTFTANGKTLVGIPYVVNVEILFDSSGNVTHVYGSGVYEKIPLPDGSLFISAGRTDFTTHGVGFLISPDKGNPGNLAGFCGALAP